MRGRGIFLFYFAFATFHLFSQNQFLHKINIGISYTIALRDVAYLPYGSKYVITSRTRRAPFFPVISIDTFGLINKSQRIYVSTSTLGKAIAVEDSLLAIPIVTFPSGRLGLIFLDSALQVRGAYEIVDGSRSYSHIALAKGKGDTLFVSGVNNDNILLVKMTVSGNILWSKRYFVGADNSTIYRIIHANIQYLPNSDQIILIESAASRTTVEIVYSLWDAQNGDRLLDTAWVTPLYPLLSPYIDVPKVNNYNNPYELFVINGAVESYICKLYVSGDLNCYTYNGSSSSLTNIEILDDSLFLVSSTNKLLIVDTSMNAVLNKDIHNTTYISPYYDSLIKRVFTASVPSITTGKEIVVSLFDPFNVRVRCGIIDDAISTFSSVIFPPASVWDTIVPVSLTVTPLTISTDSFSVIPECLCPFSGTVLSNALPYACTKDSIQFAFVGDTLGALKQIWFLDSGAVPLYDTGVYSLNGVVYTSDGFKNVEFYIEDQACSLRVTLPIVIQPSPDVSFLASDTIPCEGTPVSFVNTGSTGSQWNYSWDFGIDGQPRTAFVENPTGIQWTSPGDKIVAFTISSPYCTETFVDTIHVRDRPEAGILYPTRACQNTDVVGQFYGSMQSGAEIIWRYQNASPDSGYGPIDTTQYLWTGWQEVTQIVINPNGCTDTATTIILIDSLPQASFTTTAPVCAGQPVDFFNTGTSGSQWAYLWDFGNAGTPSLSTLENPQIVTFQYGDTFTIAFTIKNILTGCSSTDTQQIVIWPLPAANAGPPDTVVCFGDTIRLGTAPIAGYSYQWSPPIGLDDPTRADPLAFLSTPVTSYTLTVTDTRGCVNRDSIIIYMLDMPQLNAGIDRHLCPGDTIQLFVNMMPGYAYQWTPPRWLSNPEDPSPFAFPDSTITYVVSATDTSIYQCGTVYDTITLYMHGNMNLSVTPRSDTIAEGEFVRLVATGASQFYWQPDYGLDNPEVPDPLASPDTTVTYVVKGVDVYGCEAWDTVTVYVVKPAVWVPSAFSPNGDGVNDELIVHGTGFAEFELRIYDRLGGLVFHSQDPEIRWKGLSMENGEPCPEGAYVYHLYVRLTNGQIVEQEGMVNLIR